MFYPNPNIYIRIYNFQTKLPASDHHPRMRGFVDEIASVSPVLTWSSGILALMKPAGIRSPLSGCWKKHELTWKTAVFAVERIFFKPWKQMFLFWLGGWGVWKRFPPKVGEDSLRFQSWGGNESNWMKMKKHMSLLQSCWWPFFRWRTETLVASLQKVWKGPELYLVSRLDHPTSGKGEWFLLLFGFLLYDFFQCFPLIYRNFM